MTPAMRRAIPILTFTAAMLIASGLHPFVMPFGAAPALAQSILPSLGGDRAGLSGFQFTKIDVDARSAAMGSSNMADAVGAASLYWNPALASRTESSELMMGYTSYVADIPMQYVAGYARVGTFALGASLQYLSSGDMDVTTEFAPSGTGQTFRTSHYSIGLTASQRLTDSFSYGLTLRYLNERFFDVDYPTFGIDFGFFYAVGETGLRFGVGISNFGLDATADGSVSRLDLDAEGGGVTETDLQSLLLPTRFSMGMAYDVLRTDTHGLLVTAQITNPSDNAERFGLGAEYAFLRQFFLRTGYQLGVDESNAPSFGGGVRMRVGSSELAIDYAYSAFERLGDVHRMAVKWRL
jgi:hypothetical protein